MSEQQSVNFIDAAAGLSSSDVRTYTPTAGYDILSFENLTQYLGGASRGTIISLTPGYLTVSNAEGVQLIQGDRVNTFQHNAAHLDVITPGTATAYFEEIRGANTNTTMIVGSIPILGNNVRYAANDYIIGDQFNQTISGGIGADFLAGNGDLLNIKDNDKIYGGDTNRPLTNNSGQLILDDVLLGSGELYGGTGNDVLFVYHGAGFGGADSDFIEGRGDIGQVLSGEDGNDEIYGRAGDDTLNGGAGNDILNGGVGTDIAVFEGSKDEYKIEKVNATTYTVTRTATGWVDQLVDVELLRFSDGDVSLVEDPQDPVGPVTDTNGASGGTIVENAAAGTVVGITAGAVDPDTGDKVSYSLVDGGGNSVASFGGFTIDPTTGVVTTTRAFDFEVDGASVAVKIRATSSDGSSADATFAVAIQDVFERALIEGTANNDVLTGTSASEEIRGLGGNDTITSGGGNDLLVGGSGDDTYILTDGASTIVEAPNGGTDTVLVNYNPGTFTLADNVERAVFNGTAAVNGIGNAGDNRLTGTAANDTLSGGAGNDFLDGAAGNDTMIGGDGDDTYVLSSLGDVIVETGTGVDTVRSIFDYVLGDTLENLQLFSSAVSGTGNAANNLIIGTANANVLSGEGGDDKLQANAGNDTLLGGAGNDSLDGGAGADTMTGGVGNDEYFVDNAGDLVVEVGGEGVDFVRTLGISYTLADNIENLFLGIGSADGTGNALGNRIDGNELANILDGREGNDQLFGLAGNDLVLGGAGADNLNGGAGDDTLVGGAGADTLVGATGADLFVLDDRGAADRIVDFGAGDRIGVAQSLLDSVTGGAIEFQTSNLGTSIFLAGTEGKFLLATVQSGASVTASSIVVV